MMKIRSFFLQVLFLCTPLIYAWLYIPGIHHNLGDIVHFVLPGLHWSGFESVKVFFVIVLTILVLLFSLYPLLSGKIRISRAFVISILVLVVWLITSYTLNHQTNPYFLSGNPEKTHGLFLYVSLFVLFWILRGASQKEKKRLFLMSVIGFFGVTLYSFLQRFGCDPLRQLYNTRLDPWRIFSTLGNPNYLAGYVLLMLPLLRVYRFPHEVSWQEHLWEIIIWIISGILIYWTGSYLAWIFFAGYVGCVLVGHILPKRVHRIIFGVLFFVIFLFVIFWIWQNYKTDILEAQKMKGFIARWYLWKTGIAALTHDIWHFLFGFGPDGFLPISAQFRHPLLSVYEDPAYMIDRSHNVFIDFALNFGVPMTLIMLWFSARSFQKLSHEKRIALLLFALYFSFNIPVVIHFLVLIQIFTSLEKK